MKLFTFLLMSFLNIGAARAEVTDFHVGSFTGVWCNYAANFTIKTQTRNTWKFRGEIYLPKTGQIDDITIIQKADNSLVMLRSLSGASRGRTQTVITNAPHRLVRDGHTYVTFDSKETHGTGCEGMMGYLLMPY
ncbi:MAG: hypothetical protein ACXVBE_04830 [Bdellovibrionota bacterium]